MKVVNLNSSCTHAWENLTDIALHVWVHRCTQNWKGNECRERLSK